MDLFPGRAAAAVCGYEAGAERADAPVRLVSSWNGARAASMDLKHNWLGIVSLAAANAGLEAHHYALLD
jgi:hypothetical protein